MANRIGAKAIKPNPALEPFTQLIGTWRIVGSHPYIADTELHGRVTVEWIEGGAFLLMRSELDHPDIPDGIEIFGSDDKAETYYMLHFDERGVSRKYDVSIAENQLKWWRNDLEFSQRFTMDIEKDRLVSYGEM
jgi:hypothetical protein